MPKIYCGKKRSAPAGKRLGTRTECFQIGILIGKKKKKPTQGLRSIPGVGSLYEERLVNDFHITTVQELIDKFTRLRGQKRRKELLKRICKGFDNPRKVNRSTFSLVRTWMISQGIPVADMSIPR